MTQGRGDAGTRGCEEAGSFFSPRHPITASPRLFIFIALLIAGAAAWPLLAQPGLLNTRGGGDSPFLLQRLQQLVAALRGGHFPARWMPDANYGYGYPFFNFYAPLSIYIAAVFRFIGFSYVRSIHLAQLLGFITAAWGMFHLGRRWLGSNWAGLLAAAAYTLAPFHMVNVYTRGDSLAEFWAMALYPFVLLAVDGVSGVRCQVSGVKCQVSGVRCQVSGVRCQVSSVRCQVSGVRLRIALLALSYAALILSHNISALIFSPFLFLYLLLRWRQTSSDFGFRISDFGSFPQSAIRNPQSLTPIFLAILLALALAAWFFLPALGEQSLAQLGPVTEGYFHFSNHFRGVDLVQSSFFFDYSPDGGTAFRMGLAQAVTAVLGLLVLFVTRKRQLPSPPHPLTPSPPHLFIFITLLIATFMITPLSRPLWEHLPLLPFTQFPWRFLSVQALATALATAGLALLPGRRFIAPLAVGVLLVAGLGNLQTDHLILTDADVTAGKLAQYEWFTGNIGSTVSAEYLPPTVRPRPYASPWLVTGERAQPQPLAGELNSAQLVSRQAIRQTWRVVTAAAGATVRFPTLYWPGWQAAVDGEMVEARPSPSSGLITLDIPPGEHTVVLRLARTPIRLAAELISLAAVFVVGWLVWPAVGASTVLSGGRRRPAVAALALVTAVVLLAAGLRLWPERALAPDDLTWDFAQMGYLHHDTGGIAFDNGVILESYAFSHDSLAAGETLAITLTWDQTGPEPSLPATLALASPAVNRFERAPLLVSQTQAVRAGQVVYRLSIPANAPGGLYAPRLTLANGRPLTPSGKTRGDLFLRPIRVIAAHPRANQDAPPLDVRATRVQPRDTATLEVQLAWLTQQPLSHNYNFSLRLTDAVGRELAQFDAQPGYGFQPSSGWPAGQWVNDWLTLPLPAQLPDRLPYALVVRLYDVETETAVLTRRLGELVQPENALVFQATEPIFTLPDGIVPVTAVFGEAIQLHGYTLEQTNDAINLTLYWGALAAGQEDYTRFAHLINPATGQIVTQHDSMPRNNSYPTSQWTAGEVVEDTLVLSLDGVPSGEYQIVLGFYRHLGDSFPRLTAVDAGGLPFSADRVPLPEIITVKN